MRCGGGGGGSGSVVAPHASPPLPSAQVVARAERQDAAVSRAVTGLALLAAGGLALGAYRAWPGVVRAAQSLAPRVG